MKLWGFRHSVLVSEVAVCVNSVPLSCTSDHWLEEMQWSAQQLTLCELHSEHTRYGISHNVAMSPCDSTTDI